MADLVAQGIFHSFIAAVTIEALLRIWRVTAAQLRLAFRALTLFLPLALLPFFALATPERGTAAFREDYALFAGSRWADVRLLGVDAFGVWLAVLAALGAILFLRDLVPLVRDTLARGGGDGARPAPEDAPVARLTGALAARMGLPPPAVLVVERALPVLLCAGARQPRLVVSTAALELLDGEELRAAVAHELAHVRHRDALASWLLLAARALLFFNPVFQIVARLWAREAEWRADTEAARATGLALPLASGLLKLYRSSTPRRRARRWFPIVAAGPLALASSAAVVTRCRRLLDGDDGALPLAGARLVMTALSLSTLLFFVV